MIQPDQMRIEKIIETAERLLRYIEENRVTGEQIETDYTLQWTVTTPLYNIGEHTYHLTKELKEQYPAVPWYQISGMRHRLVHQYEDTNWKIISHVIFHELANYVEQLKKISEESLS